MFFLKLALYFHLLYLRYEPETKLRTNIVGWYDVSQNMLWVFIQRSPTRSRRYVDILCFSVYLKTIENRSSVTTRYITFRGVSQMFEAGCGAHSAGLHASSITRLKPHTHTLEMFALWLFICYSWGMQLLRCSCPGGGCKGNSNYAVFIPPWHHILVPSTRT